MSKFGAHVSPGGRNLFGAALQQCHVMGSPVPLLFALDQDLWPDVERYSPETVLIFRTQIDGYDNPPNIYAVDPVAAANDWYGKCKPKWLLNRAHYYAPSNERNPNSADQDAWVDLFDLRLMQLADVDGFKLALRGDSMGTPDYPQWLHYSASLAYAALRGHIITLHEPVAGADLALRYRDVHELVEPFAPGLKIAISECYGNLGASWPDYVKSFYLYDDEAMNDPYMLGFAAYQLGGAENWAEAIPQWADYVSAHPTPQPVEPPSTDREFDHWLDVDSNTVISADNPLSLTVDRNRNIRAVTRPKAPPVVTYSVTVSADYGSVSGGGTYAAGSVARLEWMP